MSNSANFKMDVNGIVNADGEEDMAAGDMKLWPSEVVPSNWMVRDGRALSRVAYATLFAVLGTRYGAGDGATTFNIPDDRGLFERCADMGKGIDAGRGVGSLQQDAMQGHEHIVANNNNGGPGGLDAGVPAQTMGNLQSWGVSANGQKTIGAFSDGVNGTPRMAGETRPVNRAYLPLIKYQ